MGDAELAQQQESPPVLLFDSRGTFRLPFPKARMEPRVVLAAVRFPNEQSPPAERQECFGNVSPWGQGELSWARGPCSRYGMPKSVGSHPCPKNQHWQGLSRVGLSSWDEL